MSSQAVRDAFRAKLVAEFPAVPLIDVYAQETDNETLPPLWFVIGFAAIGEERLTLDEPSYWSETGVVRVRVAGLTGEGEAETLVLSDQVRDAFRYWKQDGIEIDFTLPPGEENPESDGRWVFADVDLQYTRMFLV